MRLLFACLNINLSVAVFDPQQSFLSFCHIQAKVMIYYCFLIV
ncbi:hypothetical protein PAUR_a2723 [Pseudoalteromonas aurantia 208]|uniref:Orphan protein n=1 Tax=Pseudoalteromonas aurantia 208 TaxID=1314867 RepID=A0ABR9EGU9_9GAMM|nr:hypothetical protein [Pseudoalteromonas aurantia 208]